MAIDKKETPAAKEDLRKEYTFKTDYKVGSKKDGSPKKAYKKGDKAKLDEATANYLISKNIIQ